MSREIDWNAVPEEEFNRYKKRLEIVELILDGSIDGETKQREKHRYCQENGVSLRTVSNYLRRYAEKGPKGLLFYRPRKRSPRIYEEQLRQKLIAMVQELPTRSVPTMRRLLSEDEKYKDKIASISDRTVYRFLVENGLSQKERFRLLSETARRAYRSFEAAHSMALVQADARDGIWLALPDGKTRKTYLFLWVDDFSRKILFGKYYLSEKLPCMLDSFKYMILRYGIPAVVYIDNGAVYISRQFAAVLAELGIKQLRHKPYQAHAKGKIESDQKTIKRQFQAEASLAGFHTLEELNSAFWAWSELVYNKKVHSTTGQTPDDRFLKGLPGGHRRITDIDQFNAMFLWRESRTVSKYGNLKLFSNQYPVEKVSHGTVVQVRFNPFKLDEVYIYDSAGTYLETTWPTKKVHDTVPNVPEESKNSPAKISQDSVNFFTKLREKHLKAQKQNQEIPFAKLFRQEEKDE